MENYSKLKEKKLVEIKKAEKFWVDGEIIVYTCISRYNELGDKSCGEDKTISYFEIEKSICATQKSIENLQEHLFWLQEFKADVDSTEVIILIHNYLVKVIMVDDKKKAEMKIFYTHEGSPVEVDEVAGDRVFDNEKDAMDYVKSIDEDQMSDQEKLYANQLKLSISNNTIVETIGSGVKLSI